MGHWILGLLLLFPLSVQAFPDVERTDPDRPIFEHLQAVGVMSTDGQNQFRPQVLVTRAEALVIALRAGGIAIPATFSGETFYTDVDPNTWYAPAVARAVETKVLFPNQSSTFRPEQVVSKAEFIRLLLRSTNTNLRPFLALSRQRIARDVTADDWFAIDFAYAQKYGLVPLLPDSLMEPQALLNRRAVAQITYQQLRLFYGDTTTDLVVELEAAIERLLLLVQAQKNNEAEIQLQQIQTLIVQLSRLRNDENTILASILSLSMDYLIDALRAFQRDYRLLGLEKLLLAEKQAAQLKSAGSHWEKLSAEISELIHQTISRYTLSQN